MDGYLTIGDSSPIKIKIKNIEYNTIYGMNINIYAQKRVQDKLERIFKSSLRNNIKNRLEPKNSIPPDERKHTLKHLRGGGY